MVANAPVITYDNKTEIFTVSIDNKPAGWFCYGNHWMSAYAPGAEKVGEFSTPADCVKALADYRRGYDNEALAAPSDNASAAQWRGYHAAARAIVAKTNGGAS